MEEWGLTVSILDFMRSYVDEFEVPTKCKKLSNSPNAIKNGKAGEF
jgi:hypothetical protein